jgi:hypothetical protein
MKEPVEKIYADYSAFRKEMEPGSVSPSQVPEPGIEALMASRSRQEAPPWRGFAHANAKI